MNFCRFLYIYLVVILNIWNNEFAGSCCRLLSVLVFTTLSHTSRHHSGSSTHGGNKLGHTHWHLNKDTPEKRKWFTHALLTCVALPSCKGSLIVFSTPPFCSLFYSFSFFVPFLFNPNPLFQCLRTQLWWYVVETVWLTFLLCGWLIVDQEVCCTGLLAKGLTYANGIGFLLL